jgi:5-methylcytosine-specific restriction protein A
MALADVTRSAVLAAVAEFDRLGRDEFLRTTGFGSAKSYFLIHDGEQYDAGAIVGFAHGISGDRPWRPTDLSGGDATAVARLRELGFAARFVRNPPWKRDEIILACALVEQNGWRTVAQEDRRAIELSRLLQTPAFHPQHTRAADFRNPAGVERKTGDLKTRHPHYKGTRTNGNHLDEEVALAFYNRPAEMRREANAIRMTLLAWGDEVPAQPEIDDPAVEEGGVLLREHLRRERDPKLKARKLEDARQRGIPIVCEPCGFDFGKVYGSHGEGYIECHHRTPLGVTGKTLTKLADLALVCSNCHRMIHRNREWLSVEELRDLVCRSAARPVPDAVTG